MSVNRNKKPARHSIHSIIACSFSRFSKRQRDTEKKFEGGAALKADTAGCHEQFKLAALLSRRYKKQTVQSLLPESALTPGKISSREGRMFCVELLEVTHHSLELSGERAGTQPHTCFFFFLFFFLNPKPVSIALNEWTFLDVRFADLDGGQTFCLHHSACEGK